VPQPPNRASHQETGPHPKYRVWFGGYTSVVHGQPGGAGLVAATIDPADGVPRVAGASAALADPSFLAWSHDARLLYACGESKPAGYVAAFSVDSAGLPSLRGRQPVGGAGPTHISVHPAGRHVFTANYDSGSVTVVPVQADGTLGERSDVVRHQGRGPDPDRQGQPHPHQVMPDVTGTWLAVPDLGTDTVHVYRFDARAGKLTPHHQLALRPGSGPRHLVFHPDRPFAYLVSELSSTVTVLGWDAGRGLFAAHAELPALLRPTGQVNYPGAIIVSPDGRFVYVSNRSLDASRPVDDTISAFAISDDGSALTPLGAVPVGGLHPRDLRIDPDGRRIYTANQFSHSVSWLDLDADTGLPRLAGTAKLSPGVSSVLFAPSN
jgi:6-phosphogluconolactonase